MFTDLTLAGVRESEQHFIPDLTSRSDYSVRHHDQSDQAQKVANETVRSTQIPPRARHQGVSSYLLYLQMSSAQAGYFAQVHGTILPS